jgi:hypothetical protein
MKSTGSVLLVVFFLLSACVKATPLPTATPVKFSDTPIPQATFTNSPTHALIPTSTPTETPTQTPIGPVSFTYEGVTLNCICIECICITNLTFTVRLTIDAQGYVTGTFEKYLPDYPAIPLEGVKTNILGSVQDDNAKGNFMDFQGSLNKSMRTLNATLSFRGPNGTGKREVLFTQK